MPIFFPIDGIYNRVSRPTDYSIGVFIKHIGDFTPLISMRPYANYALI